MRDQWQNYEGVVVVDFLLVQPSDTSKKFESKRTLKLQATLRIAEQFQHSLKCGFSKNRAALAAQYGMTRARVTQILALRKLHPEILRYVTELDPDSGTILSERQLRPLLSMDLDDQLTAARLRLPGFKDPEAEAVAC